MRGKWSILMGLLLYPLISIQALTWSDPIPLSTEGSNTPQVAINNSGKAIAIWRGSDRMNALIQAASYDGSAWSSPATLSAGGTDAFSPQIAINDNGQAMAVWYRSDGTNTLIQGASCDGSAWSIPATLSVGGENAFSPQVAINDSGKAITVWQRLDGMNNRVQAAIYDGSAWNPVVTDLSAEGGDAYTPQVAIDDSGKAIVIWQRFDGMNDRVQAASYDGFNWSLPTDLSAEGGDASSPRFAINVNGKAIAVWLRFDGMNDRVQAASYDGSNWSPLVTDLSVLGQVVENPQVAIDGSGKAIAVWQCIDGMNTHIQEASYDGSAWSVFNNISEMGQNAFLPQIAIDDSGKAIAVWQSFDGMNTRIQEASYDGSAWRSPTNISEMGQDAFLPQVAINNSGKVIAVWQSFDGTNDSIQAASTSFPQVAVTSSETAIAVWQSFDDANDSIQAASTAFSPLPPLLPHSLGLLFIQASNNNLFQKDDYVRLEWSSPGAFTPVRYLITRNGSVIATVPATTFSFANHYLSPGTTYEYSVTAQDDTGTTLLIGKISFTTP